MEVLFRNSLKLEMQDRINNKTWHLHNPGPVGSTGERGEQVHFY